MKRGSWWKVFLVSLVVTFGTGFIGSIFTSSKVNTSWYDSIRPSITPPNFVFPIVWNILFLLIAISLTLVWLNAKKKNDKTKIVWVFGINFFLNAIWSVLFFGMQNPLAGFIDIILVWISILSMIYITYRINKLSSYFLIPYFLWVSFASAINYLAIR